MKYRHLLPCLMGALCVVVHAEEKAIGDAMASEEKPLHRDTYGGLVANQTMTVAGQDFYRHFVTAWRDKAGSERYTISIHEQPSARFGGRIWVEFAHRRIFQASLPPARASIRPLSEQAVEITYEAVIDAQVQQALFRNPDMAADELQ